MWKNLKIIQLRVTAAQDLMQLLCQEKTWIFFPHKIWTLNDISGIIYNSPVFIYAHIWIGRVIFETQNSKLKFSDITWFSLVLIC